MNAQNVQTATSESAETWIKTGSLYDHWLTDAPEDVALMPGRVVTTFYQSYGPGVIETMGDHCASVVFEAGGRLERVGLVSLRGNMWQLHNERASAELVERLAVRADAHAAIEKRDLARRQAGRIQERERLRRDADHAHLKPVTDGRAARVAANIRADLKHHFKLKWPGVKFSVKTSGYDSISVLWTDGPTEDKVNVVVRKYKNGAFDAMQDMFEYDESPFNAVFGGVKYTHANREFSDDYTERAIAILKKSGDVFAADEVITVNNYRSGRLYREGCAFFTWGYQGEIRRIMSEME